MTKVLGSKLSTLWTRINTILVPRQATVTRDNNVHTVTLQNANTTPDTLVSFDIPIESVDPVILTYSTGHYVKLHSTGDFQVTLYDDNDNPTWNWYMSTYGNLARREWDGSAWGTAEYYIPVSQWSTKFSATTVSITPGAIAANGGTKFDTASAARSGYTPIAISGWYLNGIAGLSVYCCRLSGTDIQYGLRNPNSSVSSSTGKFEVQVLYVKNS